MSSFRVHARKVRNTEIPIVKRLEGLRGCILYLRTFYSGTYAQAIENFEVFFGIESWSVANPPTNQQLEDVVDRIESLRNNELVRQRLIATRNLRAKLNCKNQQRSRRSRESE
jgi:hypothetical protein